MQGCCSTISCERYCYPTGYKVTMASKHDWEITPRGTVTIDEWGTSHLEPVGWGA